MTQRQHMQKALDAIALPELERRGFCGAFPHYKKTSPERIELLSFHPNKYGHSFTIEISTVFPGETDSLRQNCAAEAPPAPGEWNVFCTGHRFRLPGMFDGWFYYTDVYRREFRANIFRKWEIYTAVSEARAQDYVPRDEEVLVQQSCEGLYAEIAHEVNRQMHEAYRWWETHDTPKKMMRGTR